MLGQETAMAPMSSPVPKPMTLTEKLQERKKLLEDQLDLVNKAIAAVDAIPEVKTAIDAIHKLGVIY